MVPKWTDSILLGGSGNRSAEGLRSSNIPSELRQATFDSKHLEASRTRRVEDSPFFNRRNDSVLSMESKNYGASTGMKQTSFFHDYLGATGGMKQMRATGAVSNFAMVKAAAEIRDTLTNAST